MLDVTNNAGRLHLIVTARHAGERDEGELEVRDAVDKINQTHSRINTRFSGEFHLTHTFTRVSHVSN